MKILGFFDVGRAASVAAFVLFAAQAFAQAQVSSSSADQRAATTLAVHDLQEQVHQLQIMVEQMRNENAESRAEMRELRQELQDTRNLLQSSPVRVAEPSTPLGSSAQEASTTSTPTSAAPSPTLEDRVQKLEDSASLLSSKVDEQYQTKVETASKYRARLSGIILMNAFRNVGASNNLDFPDYAQTSIYGVPSASFGATLRQSEIGLEIFGPNLAGAKSSADIQLDFAGGFPATGNGVNFGIARLQTASMRLDWAHTSVVAGQDALFISPLSPTSFASLATPTFAYTGNLWAWTPQLRVEHHFDLSDTQTLTVQAGILDNLDWEYPANSFYRSAEAGEQSGQPAYAARTAWSIPLLGRPLTIGGAGYYGRQNWSWGRRVDAWAGMTDWQIPLAPRFTLSGEFYRGRAIGGLGGAIGTSIVYGGNPNYADVPIRGLNDAGGWTQLKFQLTPKIEFNGVFAEDSAFAGDVRGFAIDQNNFGPILGRNRGALGNVVYRPRSDLLFSAELKRLHTFPVYDQDSITNQVNLSMGILF